MSQVQVTFLMEADDPEHNMGLSASTFEQVSSAIRNVGGYDIEFKKVACDGDNVQRPMKPRPKGG